LNTIRKMLVAVVTLLAGVPAHALVIGITEGVTYRASDKEIEDRFTLIAEQVSREIRQPVSIRILSSYNAMRDALAKQEVDVAFIHPTHVALAAIKSGKYRHAAWTAGFTEYRVSLLCKAEPIQTWAAVSGKSLVTPDPDSITAVIVRAMLRDAGVAPSTVKLQTTRFQDAIPFYVENKFADFGATAAKGVINDWKAQGGAVCAQSKPVPIKYWIVSTRVDPVIAAEVIQSLQTLDKTEGGRRALAPSTYSGFLAPSESVDNALITFLGI
jgi:phosphonate transport system substrate-binding protein